MRTIRSTEKFQHRRKRAIFGFWNNPEALGMNGHSKFAWPKEAASFTAKPMNHLKRL
jgi:hypothetical protein